MVAMLFSFRSAESRPVYPSTVGSETPEGLARGIAVMDTQELAEISIALIECETSTLLLVDSALHWLTGTEPRIGEARAALSGIVEDAARRCSLLMRLRALASRSDTDALTQIGSEGVGG